MPGLPPGLPPGWSPESEQAFQRDMLFAPGWRDWRREFMNREGQPPVLAPGGDYDYRKAWLHGAAPQVDPGSGEVHGVSAVEAPPWAAPLSLKTKDHPTVWMEDFMQRFQQDPGTLETWTPAQQDFMRGVVTKGLEGAPEGPLSPYRIDSILRALGGA